MKELLKSPVIAAIIIALALMSAAKELSNKKEPVQVELKGRAELGGSLTLSQAGGRWRLESWKGLPD